MRATIQILVFHLIGFAACDSTQDGGDSGTKAEDSEPGSDESGDTGDDDDADDDDAGDDDDDGTGDDDDDNGDDDDDDSDGCSDGLTLCDGDCVDTQSDALHCGACSHECRIVETGDSPLGGCYEGACLPTAWDCFAESDGLPTCDDFCETLDETCAEKGCGAEVTYYLFGDSTQCDEHETPGEYGAACDEPIDWVVEGTSARCCCTNTR